MASKSIRFAVIGCGRMGRRRMRTVADHPDGELMCVVDVNDQMARSASEEYRCPYYLDYREALSREKIDCVVVSVPNRWHSEIAVAALNAKKHVFCEKPLSRNPREALEIVEAADRKNVTLKTGSNLRFFRSVLKAKELLDHRAIGDLLFLRSWIGHDGWNLYDGWYAQPEVVGGGTFLDNGCHILDISRWFLGEVESCIGIVKTNLRQVQPLEDNGFGLFEMVEGKTAFIQSSWTEWAGYMYMEVYGTEGYVRVDNRGEKSQAILGKPNGLEEVFDYSSFPPDSYQLEFEDYVRAILDGRQALPSGYDGLRAVQMAWGVYESARTGRKIKLCPPPRGD